MKNWTTAAAIVAALGIGFTLGLNWDEGDDTPGRESTPPVTVDTPSSLSGVSFMNEIALREAYYGFCKVSGMGPPEFTQHVDGTITPGCTDPFATATSTSPTP